MPFPIKYWMLVKTYQLSSLQPVSRKWDFIHIQEIYNNLWNIYYIKCIGYFGSETIQKFRVVVHNDLGLVPPDLLSQLATYPICICKFLLIERPMITARSRHDETFPSIVFLQRGSIISSLSFFFFRFYCFCGRTNS